MAKYKVRFSGFAYVEATNVLEAVDGYADGNREDLCGAKMSRRAESAVNGIRQYAAASEDNRLILDISDDE